MPQFDMRKTTGKHDFQIISDDDQQRIIIKVREFLELFEKGTIDTKSLKKARKALKSVHKIVKKGWYKE